MRVTHFQRFPWGRIECYVAGLNEPSFSCARCGENTSRVQKDELQVPSADRFHTAKPTPSGDTGDSGAPQDWSAT